MNETLFDVFLERWKLLVACTLLGLSAGALFHQVRPPVYTATAYVLVSPVDSSRAIAGTGVVVDSIQPVRAMQTAAALLETSEAGLRTSQRLGDDWTIQAIDESVQITPRGESNILSIAAKASSPELAAELATAYAEESVAARDEFVSARASDLLEQQGPAPSDDDDQDLFQDNRLILEALASQGDPSLSVAGVAAVPLVPSSPSRILTMLVAAVAGGLCGVGGALISRSISTSRNRSSTRLVDRPDDSLAGEDHISSGRDSRDVPLEYEIDTGRESLGAGVVPEPQVPTLLDLTPADSRSARPELEPAPATDRWDTFIEGLLDHGQIVLPDSDS